MKDSVQRTVVTTGLSHHGLELFVLLQKLTTDPSVQRE